MSRIALKESKNESRRENPGVSPERSEVPDFQLREEKPPTGPNPLSSLLLLDIMSLTGRKKGL